MDLSALDDFLLSGIRYLNISVDVKVDEEFPIWILPLIFVQAVLTFVGTSGGFLVSLIVLKRRNLFHRNFKILAMNSAVLWLIAMMCRFIVAVGSLFNWRIPAVKSQHVVMSPFIYFELIRVASGYAGIFSIGIITFERVIATIYIQTYEKNTHTHVAVPTIFVIWMFGILSAVLGYGKTRASLFTISGLLGVLVTLIGGYRFVVETNKKLSQSKINSFQYTLSQKFQLKENLKVISIFKKYVKTFLPVAIIVGSIWITVALLYYFSNNASLYYLTREVGKIVNCLASTIMLYAYVTGTHGWSRDIKALFRWMVPGSRRLSRGEIAPATILVNSKGNQISFQTKQEGNIYFSQLKLVWGEPNRMKSVKFDPHCINGE